MPPFQDHSIITMTKQNEYTTMETGTEIMTMSDIVTSQENVPASSPWQLYVYNSIGAVGLISNGFVVMVISQNKNMRSKITNR